MRRPRAFCLIRQQPLYRHEAFEAGLAAAGFEVHHDHPRYPIAPGEVLLIWNRYDLTERLADQFEAAGGIVLVAENGYLGVDRNDRRIYAIARGRHNGGGVWPDGGPERLDALGVDVAQKPATGDYILIAANRSFGTRGNIMPLSWADDVAGRIRKITRRPIRVRHHPGNLASSTPLAKDLEQAHAVVIWSSSVGVEALVRGIPVFSEANWWICKSATWPAIELIEDWAPSTALRMAALQRLAWAQWTVDEIVSGLPFRLLTGPAETLKAESCTSTAAATSTA